MNGRPALVGLFTRLFVDRLSANFAPHNLKDNNGGFEIKSRRYGEEIDMWKRPCGRYGGFGCPCHAAAIDSPHGQVGLRGPESNTSLSDAPASQ